MEEGKVWEGVQTTKHSWGFLGGGGWQKMKGPNYLFIDAMVHSSLIVFCNHCFFLD